MMPPELDMPEPLQRATERVRALDAHSASEAMRSLPIDQAIRVLAALPVGQAVMAHALLPTDLQQTIASEAMHLLPWLGSERFPDGSVGRLLEAPSAVFGTSTRVDAAISALRDIVKRRMVTYVFVTTSEGILEGVVAFRELVFADATQTLGEIMLRAPFSLRPEKPLVDAMREVVTRHYPVYPICDAEGRLLGMVRGQVLFEQQAFEISAQAGAMVGVEREERLATPWARSFRFRAPWLLLNLLTVFIAAAVVGAFQDAIDKLVVLALFLPVVAGQSGNLGAQALAVTLRAMTLGEVRQIRVVRLLSKEAWLGALNGSVTGVLAAMTMYVVATRQGEGDPLWLAIVTLVAMTLSCALSGIIGALVPLLLKRAGADPATASAILLSTATDVISMGGFLALATWWAL
ncbi:MAG TPA: magnesium transporter [Aquimonas sp.]|jgi:magnesium transporter|nr:magnesium transporter [Aquimonas sp.]HRF53930.1 magnesium transporter [Aquimonas sp.]